MQVLTRGFLLFLAEHAALNIFCETLPKLR